MIKGLAFDLEGTVVDVELAHHKAHLQVARDVGLSIDLEEAFYKIPHFIGGPDELVIEEIYKLGNKSLSKEEMLRRDKQNYKSILSETEIKCRPGFKEFLGEVKKKHLKIAIGSLTSSVDAQILLERSDLYGLFEKDVIVLREHVKEVKPAPDVFLETARRMEINPSEQIVFEDSSRGIMAAIKAGSIAIGMPVYNQPNIINSLRNAGAKNIFYSWQDVKIDKLVLF